MKKSLENKILLRCPIIYRGRNDGPQRNLMYFGFECGSGWFKVIYDLSIKIEGFAADLQVRGVKDDQLPIVSQVKEKFGGLRFYVNNYHDDIETLIEEAEELSSITCEDCGQTGKRRNLNGWIKTVCDSCVESYEK